MAHHVYMSVCPWRCPCRTCRFTGVHEDGVGMCECVVPKQASIRECVCTAGFYVHTCDLFKLIIENSNDVGMDSSLNVPAAHHLVRPPAPLPPPWPLPRVPCPVKGRGGEWQRVDLDVKGREVSGHSC